MSVHFQRKIGNIENIWKSGSLSLLSGLYMMEYKVGLALNSQIFRCGLINSMWPVSVSRQQLG